MEGWGGDERPMQGNGPDEEHTDPHGECAAEIHRLQDALKAIKDHCTGDARPRWDRGMATSASRGFIMDVCDAALGNIK